MSNAPDPATLGASVADGPDPAAGGAPAARGGYLLSVRHRPGFGEVAGALAGVVICAAALWAIAAGADALISAVA